MSQPGEMSHRQFGTDHVVAAHRIDATHLAGDDDHRQARVQAGQLADG